MEQIIIDNSKKYLSVIREELKDIINEDLEVTPQMSFSIDIQMDSIQSVMLFSALEEKFNICFSAEQLMEVETVEDLVTILYGQECKRK